MNTKTPGLILVVSLLASAACFAANPQVGTWKLNEAKSKMAPGMGKNTTVTYKDMLGNAKVTIDGTDAKGKPTHNEWTGKFDGKDYAVTGDPNSDMRAYTKVNDRTMNFVVKKNGKTTMSGQIMVSADGKTRTVTVSGTDPRGKRFKTTAVYDKQ